MSKDIQKMVLAAYEIFKEGGPPKDLFVGDESAEVFGLPHAGHWHLNDNNEYVFKGPLTEESEW
jgi:hypothetical protein